MKNNISVLPIHTDQVLFMREQQVRSQFEEIINQVNCENVSVLFWGIDQTVVLSPYWWYIPVLGPDPREAINFLFEVSKLENEDMAMKYTGVALGFIRMTTREAAGFTSGELAQRFDVPLREITDWRRETTVMNRYCRG